MTLLEIRERINRTPLKIFRPDLACKKLNEIKIGIV